MFGPRPLNRAREPSVWQMCFRHCQIETDWTDVERPHWGIARIDGRRRLRSELGHTRCREWLWLWWSELLELILVLRSWWCSFWPANLPSGDADEAIRGGILLWINGADELCKRVLTTSSGHVTTAPAVPAIPPANRWMNVSRSRWDILFPKVSFRSVWLHRVSLQKNTIIVHTVLSHRGKNL